MNDENQALREPGSKPVAVHPGPLSIRLFNPASPMAVLTPDSQLPQGFQGRSPWLAT
jgi:hypothetical protein